VILRAARLALLPLLILAPAAWAAWPAPENGPIVWTSAGDLWTENGRLTETPEAEAQATWSPDGRRIAFRSGTSPYRIAVMNADGSGRVLIGGSDHHETQPAWSPDGTRILYRRSVPGENLSGDIWTMRADGTDQQPLVVTAGADERYPAAAPRSTRVAYTSNRDGDYEIFVGDGPVTSNAVFDSGPSWSPDGRRIAFERGSAGDADDLEIWTMTFSGDDQQQLTVNGVRDEGPAWSPRGDQIAFSSTRGGESHIWRMSQYGDGDATRVSAAGAAEESSDWGTSPQPRPDPVCSCLPEPQPGPPPPPPPVAQPLARDADSDDDGLSDVRERRLRTSPVRRDTDRDGLHDGQELGIARPLADTLRSRFRADRDPRTRTSPLRRDTDRDGLGDGREDRNRNGRRDRRETDPRRKDTDRDGLSDRRDARPLSRR
jgi:hypothetical protein